MDDHTYNSSQSLFVLDVHNRDRNENGYSQSSGIPSGMATAKCSGRRGWFALWQGQQLSSSTHVSRLEEVCLCKLSILLRHVYANLRGEKKMESKKHVISCFKYTFIPAQEVRSAHTKCGAPAATAQSLVQISVSRNWFWLAGTVSFL